MIARGIVSAAAGEMLEVAMPPIPVGGAVRVACEGGPRAGVVVGSHANGVRVALLDAGTGVVAGARVEEDVHGRRRLALGTAALGRTIERFDVAEVRAIGPAQRVAVDAPLSTGVRAIDALLTIGRGARVGIFGEPGAGKTTLLETILAGTGADAVVLALIGERGREAERWIARLDERTTIVCATSDRCAYERVAATKHAFAQASALARRGLHVLLVLDSLARVAYALRECGGRDGESIGRGGYPAGTFAALARLVESSGAFSAGSITLIATVLSDGDDRDPVSEAARSLLDGHITLSPELARAGRFPAIDVPRSASRTMDAVVDDRHRAAAARVRRALASLEETRDLRSLGVEPAAHFDRAAVQAEEAIEALLRQGRAPVNPAESLAMLLETADTLGEPHGHHL